MATLLGQLGYPTTEEAAAARIARLVAEPGTRLFVAESGEGVVGLAGMHVMRVLEYDDPVCAMIALVVREDDRRKGVGRLLTRAVEEAARAAGCERIILGSAEQRSDAHAFYEDAGYEQTGRRFVKVVRGRD